MLFRCHRQIRDSLKTIAVLLVEGHDHLLRTLKEFRMSIESDLADLRAEVAATQSAEAAAVTAFNGVVQQLQAIQRQNAGNPTGMAASIEAFTASLAASRGAMTNAITANTPGAGQPDPSAPPPAANSGSTGTNVFGSKGPEDTVGVNGDRSGFTTGTGALGAQGTAPLGATGATGSTGPALAPTSPGDPANTGEMRPVDAAPAPSTVAPDQTKPVGGETAVEQDRPAGTSEAGTKGVTGATGGTGSIGTTGPTGPTAGLEPR